MNLLSFRIQNPTGLEPICAVPADTHAEGVKMNSRGQRPRIERQKMSTTPKGSNINSTLSGSNNQFGYVIRGLHPRLFNSSPSGTCFSIHDLPFTIHQGIHPLPETNRISFVYQLMISQAGFYAAQAGSARGLAE
jgi:hypothetical protein